MNKLSSILLAKKNEIKMEIKIDKIEVIWKILK